MANPKIMDLNGARPHHQKGPPALRQRIAGYAGSHPPAASSPAHAQTRAALEQRLIALDTERARLQAQLAALPSG